MKDPFPRVSVTAQENTPAASPHAGADIAIVGMACLFPGAGDIRAYWRNITGKVCSISDPPPDWEAALYFDPAAKGNDRTYCMRGGYLGDLATFDPLAFRVMPGVLDGGEPDQFLALRVAQEALADGGFSEGSTDPERTEVIVGRGTYINRGVTNSFQHTVGVDQTLAILRQVCPTLGEETLATVRERMKAELPPFTADTVPGFVPNILTGRIANRLDFMGVNYLVDAACASSLVAVEHGMRDLRSGRCDLALVGGVNASIPPTMLVIFSLINALSRRRTLMPFDAGSDGTMLGEGLGFVALQRLADARREGRRVYAVLKAVGVASDGRGLGPLSPRVEGEALAIRRAYEEAGIDPRTVALVEAHGTGTPVGDVTEVRSLASVFGGRRGARPQVALGTVKSMIAHLIPASGMAGLIKTALALYHKVLPPTLCERPNPELELEKTPFYLNTETRPWFHGGLHPRRAGVNAFGFGGINAHALLEEDTAGEGETAENFLTAWDAEVFLFQGESVAALADDLRRAREWLTAHPATELKDLAFTLNTRPAAAMHRLTIIAATGEELVKKIDHAAKKLADPACKRIRDRSGIFYFREPLAAGGGKVALLFPGEGSQYDGMLADLCLHFPEARGAFDALDRAFADHGRGYLPSHAAFPLPLGQETGEQGRLWAMDSAAEAVFTANLAMFRLLAALGLRADAMVGHSTGEYAALLAAGIVDVSTEERFIGFVRGVNRVYEEVAAAGGIAAGVLLSVGAARPETLAALHAEYGDRLLVAMDNCPQQSVLCGPEEVIAPVAERLRQDGALVERLPFSRAYHTPKFAPMSRALLAFFQTLDIQAPALPLYSCVTAAPFPDDPAAVRELATSQWARQVRFTDTVRALYGDGVRIFIEVGPRNNLTSFVENILRGEPHLAVASNVQRRSGVYQLNFLVALLAAHHVPFEPGFLYRYRRPVRLTLEDAPTREKNRPPRTPVPIRLTLPRPRLEGFAPPAAAPATSGRPDLLQPPPSAKNQVMEHYLRTMDRFLAAQREVHAAFFAARAGRSAPGGVLPAGQGEPTAPPPLPFVREMLSLEAGRKAVARCTLDLDQDPFLRHHTLGALAISAADESLAALPVSPLTFTMEMMAEVASLLAPGKVLIGMREVRASRWIALDRGRVTLRIQAEAPADLRDPIQVTVFEEEEGGRSRSVAVAEGGMLFDATYPPAPAPLPRELDGSRPSRWSGKDLYDGFMFHGPTLRSVASMESWGENGATGTLTALPLAPLLRGRNPLFLADPVVLDAAGQVIAYWTSDHLEKAFHIFPFRLEALTLYGPNFAASETVECRARIALRDELLVRSDIDLVTGDGALRMRLIGWWDRRFDQPNAFFNYRVAPKTAMLSEQWPHFIQKNNQNPSTMARILQGLKEDFLNAHNRIWLRVLAHLTLSRTERLFWQELPGGEKKRRQWLLGRIVAKDALRDLLFRKTGISVFPADIVIDTDENGRPRVSAIHGMTDAPRLQVSIAHCEDMVFAAVSEKTDGAGLGVDIERVRPLDEVFVREAFGPEELRLLDGCGDAQRDEWLLRFWCAKEAAGKAMGTGLTQGPRSLHIITFDRDSGLCHAIAPASGRQWPVRTVRDGDMVAAITD